MRTSRGPERALLLLHGAASASPAVGARSREPRGRLRPPLLGVPAPPRFPCQGLRALRPAPVRGTPARQPPGARPHAGPSCVAAGGTGCSQRPPMPGPLGASQGAVWAARPRGPCYRLGHPPPPRSGDRLVRPSDPGGRGFCGARSEATPVQRDTACPVPVTPRPLPCAVRGRVTRGLPRWRARVPCGRSARGPGLPGGVGAEPPGLVSDVEGLRRRPRLAGAAFRAPGPARPPRRRPRLGVHCGSVPCCRRASLAPQGGAGIRGVTRCLPEGAGSHAGGAALVQAALVPGAGLSPPPSRPRSAPRP